MVRVSKSPLMALSVSIRVKVYGSLVSESATLPMPVIFSVPSRLALSAVITGLLALSPG